MAFATTGQLCQQFDRRDIAGMCAESTTAPPNPTTIESNPIAVAAMDRASAIILSTALIANKYSEDDLETLAGNDDAFLVWLTCAIACGLLLQRRGMQGKERYPAIQESDEWLKKLRDGEAIFNVQKAMDAGNLKLVTPTVVELSDNGFLTGIGAGRFFPDRE